MFHVHETSKCGKNVTRKRRFFKKMQPRITETTLLQKTETQEIYLLGKDGFVCTRHKFLWKASFPCNVVPALGCFVYTKHTFVM